MAKNESKRDFIALNIAILTISDTRTDESDISGVRLAELLERDGHILQEKVIVPDNIYRIRAEISKWISSPKVNAILTTGGTGVTGRDGTPEAVEILFDKVIDGFGEVFRHLSYQQIKTSTMQSRSIAGVANGTYVFCLPGSVNACVTAWNEIIKFQLDSRTRPCNLVELMPRLKEK